MENFLQSIEIRFRQLSPARRRWVLLASVLVAFLPLFMITTNQRPKTPSHAVPTVAGTPGPIPDNSLIDVPRSAIDSAYRPQTVAPRAYESYKTATAGSLGLPNEPRIAYSAELSVTTKEFAHSRSSLEEILDRHHGYVAKLRMVGQPSGSVLNATLRIPSSEYRSALTDLKSVGIVEHEEESADEVTQQHNDLEARLLNAQNQERNLKQMLEDRSPKFDDLTPLERQLALLRSEIQRMQIERNAYLSPVAFANISFSLQEEHTAPAETLAAQLKSAAVSGFGDVLATLSTILLFAVSRGPLLLLWAVLLFIPARYFWRRRSLFALREAPSAKTT
jgi:hypothetical protein